MGKSNFIDAVKQRMIPQQLQPTLMPAVPQVPSATGPLPGVSAPGMNSNPQSGLVSPAERLSIAQLMAPGGQGFITDIDNSYWFSALQPIQPMAPATYRPRQRAFNPGENLIWNPGDDKGGVTFEMLRAMADGWDLLRCIIETRKDQLSRLKWLIRVKGRPGENINQKKKRQSTDPVVKELTAFFNKPDGFHSFNDWVRMWMEDVLVLDAAPLSYMRGSDGKIYGVMPLTGESINRTLTDQGVTPPFPSVAYQQVVYGSPACNFTVKDLLYVMRNERTWRRYGYSPVEQILVTISMALHRQDFQLQYYVSGNMPEALCFLPANMPVSRVKEVQDWFDSILAGNLVKRRRLTFLPGYGTGSGNDGARPNVVFPKEILLKDEMDDWLMRVVCYAFSVSPQNLMKQMNRSSAEQSSNVSQEEGLEPSQVLVTQTVNRIIEEIGLSDDYEFGWLEERETDPVKQATIDNLLLGKVYTINETRDRRGDDLRPEPQADMLGVFAPNGFIPIDTPVAQIQSSQGNPGGGANKLRKLKFDAYNEQYGNLADQDSFLAYDPESDMYLVKGDVALEAAKLAIQDKGMRLLT